MTKIKHAPTELDAKNSAHCTWVQDEYEDSWDGSCGAKWTFIDGGPKENGVKFCPRCGKPVEIKELLWT